MVYLILKHIFGNSVIRCSEMIMKIYHAICGFLALAEPLKHVRYMVAISTAQVPMISQNLVINCVF